jgi:hypothetical protein
MPTKVKGKVLVGFAKMHLIRRDYIFKITSVGVLGCTHRSGVRFPALPDFLSGSVSGTGSTRPHDDK